MSRKNNRKPRNNSRKRRRDRLYAERRRAESEPLAIAGELRNEILRREAARELTEEALELGTGY